MKKKVLVIDDEEDFRFILKEILTEAGYEVLRASDAMSGLETVLSSRPAIVLVDWVMPVMNGLEFVKCLRGTREISSIPVIMITVNQGKANLLEAFQAGVDHVIGKPFDAELVCANVAALISKKKF